MYQLFCDSNCELWHTEAKALGLRVIRMPYVLDGEEFYYDLGENTDFKHFYDRMRAGAVPQPSRRRARVARAYLITRTRYIEGICLRASTVLRSRCSSVSNMV